MSGTADQLLQGRDVQRLCDERGWSRSRLAHELRRVAKAAGDTLPSDESLIRTFREWVNNDHHGLSSRYAKHLEALFGQRFACVSAAPRSRRAAPAPSPAETPPAVQFHRPWRDAVAAAGQEWVEDVDRRKFLRVSGYTVAAVATPAALQWLMGQGEEVSGAAEQGTRVGQPHVESVREMTRALRRMDNLYGGGKAKEQAARYLAHDVRPLLLEGRYSSAVGRDLLSAAAELVQLTGWMTFDVGDYARGQRYSVQALRMAMAADDRALGAEILAGLSHQASYLGDGTAAVDLARAAGHTALRQGTPALVAEAHVMEAHGHARLGDGASCAASLSRAEKALDVTDRAADPSWISYFDEAYMAAKFGHCFRELRDSTAARRFAERSLVMDSAYARGRAFNLTLLATAHAQAGEVEEACAVATEAVDATSSLASFRAREYLSRLSVELAPYHAPAVRQLAATLKPLLAQAA